MLQSSRHCTHSADDGIIMMPLLSSPLQATEAQRMLLLKVNEALFQLPKFTDGELRQMGRSEYEIEAFHRDWEKKMGRKMERHRVTGEEGREATKAIQVKGRLEEGSIHVMVTSNGNPYMNWQTQLMYYTYNKVRPRWQDR